ncbi:MAG: 16S rRNA (uracil(1498)-N(3))-methyltransferase [Acidobacteriia bacterium]|nr:16S rRNA (uracil(1498)-N(3))-methyltransferase [Terriglobia bacterium]
MRRRFFVDGFHGSSAALTGDAAHHLARVLRAEPGQLFELSDGESLWLAETESVGREEIHFSLVEKLPIHPAPLRVALLLAIVKFDRLEWAIEKATELGVDEIVPLIADRSEHGLVAASPKRAERWRKILAESAQQARRLRIPQLGEAAKPRAAFAAAEAQVRLLLSERSGAVPMRALLEPAAAAVQGEGPTTVAIAIGPEGGWTDAEFSAAASAGFSEAALGANIMRTETAVCSALAAVQYAFGAFRPGGDVDTPENGRRKENT